MGLGRNCQNSIMVCNTSFCKLGKNSEKEKRMEEEKEYDSIKDVVVETLESVELAVRDDVKSPGVVAQLSEECSLLLGPADLVVVAGAPKSGKTWIALAMAKNLAMENKCPVGYFSTGPMEYSDLGKMCISQLGEVSLHKLNTGTLMYAELEAIHQAATVLYDAPLFFDQHPNSFFEELELVTRMMVEEEHVKVIFVDSLEYMEELINAEPAIYRYELDTLLEKLKTMAKELGIAVVLLTETEKVDPSTRTTRKSFRNHMMIPRAADTLLILNGEHDPMGRSFTIQTTVAKNAHGAERYVDLKFFF